MSLSQGLGRPILTQSDLQAHRASLGNTQDVVYWPLFDSASYAPAGQTVLSFFASPVGQGTTSAPGASGTKSLADTNMYAAGVLPKGNDFYMTGQEFVFFPGDAPEQDGTAGFLNYFINDTYNVGKSGVFSLQVGSGRVYIQDGPLQNFPPSTRLFVAAAIGGTDTAAATALLTVEYASWVGEPYDITPIYIEATQGFQQYVQWTAAVTVSVTARLFSRMRGYLIRNAQ